MPARPLADLRRPRSHLPPRTVRLRLTLVYGALFLISGAVLLTITYILFRHSTGSIFFGQTRLGPRGDRRVLHHLPAGQLPAAAKQAMERLERQHAAELKQLLIQSGIALGIMALASVALGWLIAGRVLRPVRAMTATARRISEHNLHERLTVAGPRDELRDLAETFDGLLARLEGAFGAQKRFVANAAHELRTPLTLLRALLEETLADPTATIDSFRATSRRLLALGEEQERLLEALLTLASGERGLEHRRPFDLSVLTDDVLLTRQPEADRLSLEIEARIAPAPTTGDPALAERLVANLIDNAARYNTPGGRVEVATGASTDHAFLSVTNTGPRIGADQVKRLFEPFQRLGVERTTRDGGHHGLGLSIVRAIATAHDATITTHAPDEGGLEIHVNFPLLKAHDHLDKTSAVDQQPEACYRRIVAGQPAGAPDETLSAGVTPKRA